MRCACRPGFTLIEVVIAAFIFAVGALALEATAAAALRRMHRSAQLTTSASVAGSRLESLAASRCAALRGGTDTVRAVVSEWAVGPAAPLVRPVTQALTYQLDGLRRRDAYDAAVRCSP